MKKLTISEIAELAGVSTATVSRVLNGKADVNQKTRIKIQRIIAENGPEDHTVSVSRERGYRRALREAEIRPRSWQIAYGDFSIESGYELARVLLPRASEGFGLLAASDLQACGAIAALKEAQIEVGQEVSVSSSPRNSS